MQNGSSKKGYFAAGLLIVCSLLIASSKAARQMPARLYDYQESRDKHDIITALHSDEYWDALDINPERMLTSQSSDPGIPGMERNLLFYVVRSNNQFVGVLAFAQLRHRGLVYIVHVEKPFRRCGYARHMVRFALEKLKESGATDVVVSTRPDNDAARNLYVSFGFEPKKETTRRVLFQKIL